MGRRGIQRNIQWSNLYIVIWFLIDCQFGMSIFSLFWLQIQKYCPCHLYWRIGCWCTCGQSCRREKNIHRNSQICFDFCIFPLFLIQLHEIYAGRQLPVGGAKNSLFLSNLSISKWVQTMKQKHHRQQYARKSSLEHIAKWKLRSVLVFVIL